AVRGNNDKGGWAARLPLTDVVEAAGARALILHDLHELAVDPAADGFAVVVSGHSHQPLIRRDGAVLYVNPGSARPRRFPLPITLGRLKIEDGALDAEIMELAPAPTTVDAGRRGVRR